MTLIRPSVDRCRVNDRSDVDVMDLRRLSDYPVGGRVAVLGVGLVCRLPPLLLDGVPEADDGCNGGNDARDDADDFCRGESGTCTSDVSHTMRFKAWV